MSKLKLAMEAINKARAFEVDAKAQEEKNNSLAEERIAEALEELNDALVLSYDALIDANVKKVTKTFSVSGRALTFMFERRGHDKSNKSFCSYIGRSANAEVDGFAIDIDEVRRGQYRHTVLFDARFRVSSRTEFDRRYKPEGSIFARYSEEVLFIVRNLDSVIDAVDDVIADAIIEESERIVSQANSRLAKSYSALSSFGID